MSMESLNRCKKPAETVQFSNGVQRSSLELYVLEHRLEVCSLPKQFLSNFTHALIRTAFLPDSRPEFFSFTESNENITLIVTHDQFKELPESEDLEKSNHPWRALAVSAGAMGTTELCGVSKIAKAVICPLADQEISVLCLSTYQSDYILVQEPYLADAISCLGSYFKIFNEKYEKIVDIKQAKKKCSTYDNSGRSRPVIHPYVSPPNKYHITGLHPSTLPSVIQILLEIMFFSSSDSLSSPHQFFHFSIIDGDYSMVLDSDSLKKFPSNTVHMSLDDHSWRMVNIGSTPFEFDIYGVVAQISEPLALAKISTYYISTYKYGHTLVQEEDIERVLEILRERSTDDDTDRESR